MTDAASMYRGGPYRESFCGFRNGADVDHDMIPISLPKDSTDNLFVLVSLAQRHDLPAKRRQIERLPVYKRRQPSWQLLSAALVSSYSDDEIGPERDLSHEKMEGKMKTRLSLLRQRSITSTVVQQTEVTLVTCDPKTGTTINAGLRYKDDQYCEFANAIPHHLSFTIANMDVVDLFTKQLYELLEKEGFMLIDDKFQPVTPPDNSFVCATRSITSAVCNDIQQSDSLTGDEDREFEGASMSDLIPTYPVCDYVTQAIAGSRVGPLSRVSQSVSSPGVPTNLGSQLQLGQTRQVQAHLSQSNRTSVHVETHNQEHEPREQMAWPRKKTILPPAAWGA